MYFSKFIHLLLIIAIRTMAMGHHTGDCFHKNAYLLSPRGQSMLRVDMSSQPPLDLHIFSQLDKEISFGLRFRLLLP